MIIFNQNFNNNIITQYFTTNILSISKLQKFNKRFI